MLLQIAISLVICATGKCNALGILSITPNDERMRDMICLEGHIPKDEDSDANSKQPEKEVLETICWTLARNSGDSLKDELIGITIKLGSAQETRMAD